MDFAVKNITVDKLSTQCAVVFVQAKKPLPSAHQLDTRHQSTISALISSGDLKDKAGALAWLLLAPEGSGKSHQRVLVVSLGSAKSKTAGKKEATKKEAIQVSEKDILTTLESVAGAVCRSNAKDVTLFFDGLTIAPSDKDHARDNEWLGQMTSVIFEKSNYRFTTTKSKKDNVPALKKVIVADTNATNTKKLKTGLARGAAIGKGINYARELGNLPGNICTPTYLAGQAKSLAAKHPKLSARGLGEKQMEKLGMGAFLSVAKGSEEEGQLILLEYKGAASTVKPHVLVGKGITFDTGGISIKPGASMDEMKFDMCGAASVLGVFKTLTELNAKVNVVGIIAAAENMPSHRASKPGDIVTSMSGQTIEILNTDAEGRLVLCDALTYAERYKPKSVVDIATLTGACVVALGNHATGLYANDQKLADALLKSGGYCHDRAWQMPLWDDYQKQLHSNFADMANIGGMPGGSITAACFLSRFTKKYKWAHLDIAGTAWKSGAAKGATGRPVSLLVDYVLNN